MVEFGPEFLFGVATASYQIEGAWNEDGKGESIWDRFSHTPGKIVDDSTGDIACDHYHRYEEDIKLLKRLGVDAYRFSISWPRIFPEGRGRVNEKGLDFYRRLIESLRENAIRPVVTLYHWDLPQTLEERGGWGSEETVEAFKEYAHFLFRIFREEVELWITHNEPWVTAFLGHSEGRMAPGKQDFALALRVSKNLLLSHAHAVSIFREEGIRKPIGIALNLAPIYPKTENDADRQAALRFDGCLNRWFLDPLFRGEFPEDMVMWYRRKGFPIPPFSDSESRLLTKSLDFLGINYCTRYVLEHGEDPALEARVARVPGGEYSSMDWEVYPSGMSEIVCRVSVDYSPRAIYITENGYPYPDILLPNGSVVDEERIAYLARHLASLHKAMVLGCPVKGYFVWSIMDNFEWSYGFSKRFGLVYVDYETLQRIPKQSFFWYQNVIRRRGFE